MTTIKNRTEIFWKVSNLILENAICTRDYRFKYNIWQKQIVMRIKPNISFDNKDFTPLQKC